VRSRQQNGRIAARVVRAEGTGDDVQEGVARSLRRTHDGLGITERRPEHQLIQVRPLAADREDDE
jgi:hypothetical protein